MSREDIGKLFVLLAAIVISLVFFRMVRGFLMSLLLAGIFTALSMPLYRWLKARLRGRSNPAAVVSILLLLSIVFVPSVILLGIVAAQAVELSGAVQPWLSERLTHSSEIDQWLRSLPYYERIEPYREQLLTQAGTIVQGIGSLAVDALTSVTQTTVGFFFQLFIILYSMFFFYKDGRALVRKILYYLPLDHEDEMELLDKFTSVSRATLKGTLIIGLVQGTMGGVAFAVVGIQSPVFWGAVMMVASIIPGIGTAIIWVPATIALFIQGHPVSAVVLALWMALAVGSVDNILRPVLVGKDTKMHELLILFSTLGGIAYFGIAGFIVGPIVAALFAAIWEIYGRVFEDVLPPVKGFDPDG